MTMARWHSVQLLLGVALPVRASVRAQPAYSLQNRTIKLHACVVRGVEKCAKTTTFAAG